MNYKGRFFRVAAIISIVAGVAFGKTDITDKFTDANFKAAVYELIGKSAPAPIYDNDVDTITKISVFGSPNARGEIVSLQGIEYITALQHLWCAYNQLTTLNVSKNIALKSLDCTNNQLTTLNVSNNIALEWLYCSNNQLTTLNVSNNIALESLDCGGNPLTTLDLSKNTALRYLMCQRNSLTTLDLSKNTALISLNCSNNFLITLDLSKNTALTSLLCWDNSLTTLDVSNNTALNLLTCNDNRLTTLDVSNNTALKTLYLVGNYFLSKNDIIGLNALNIGDNFTFGEQNDPAMLPTSIGKLALTNKTVSIFFARIKNGEINLKAGNYTAELYNLQGRLVCKAEIGAIDGLNATGIKTNNLSKGVFVLNVKQAGASVLKQSVRVY